MKKVTQEQIKRLKEIADEVSQIAIDMELNDENRKGCTQYVGIAADGMGYVRLEIGKEMDFFKFANIDNRWSPDKEFENEHTE